MYLNRCVMTLSLEDVGAPGATVPFYVETILFELEGGSMWYHSCLIIWLRCAVQDAAGTAPAATAEAVEVEAVAAAAAAAAAAVVEAVA